MLFSIFDGNWQIGLFSGLGYKIVEKEIAVQITAGLTSSLDFKMASKFNFRNGLLIPLSLLAPVYIL